MGLAKTASIAAGISDTLPSHTPAAVQSSTILVSRTMGSTASTTAVGNPVWGTMLSGVVSEEKLLALPSLPKRMQRLSNTHRPSTSVDRGVPVATCRVTR